MIVISQLTRGPLSRSQLFPFPRETFNKFKWKRKMLCFPRANEEKPTLWSKFVIYKSVITMNRDEGCSYCCRWYSNAGPAPHFIYSMIFFSLHEIDGLMGKQCFFPIKAWYTLLNNLMLHYCIDYGPWIARIGLNIY